MKTKLLQAVEPAYLSEFFDDLRKLLNPQSEALVHAALPWLRTYVASSSKSERERLATEVAQSAGADPELAKSFFAILTFIAVGTWQERSELPSPDDFCEDIQTIACDHQIEPLSESDIASLNKLLSDLATQSSEFQRSAAISRIKRGFLPMYEQVHATVELRSTQSPLSFKAKVQDLPFRLIPIASVRVTLDSGDPPTFCFQTAAQLLVRTGRRQRRVRTFQENIRTQELRSAAL
jgi:hypothetical protein